MDFSSFYFFTDIMPAKSKTMCFLHDRVMQKNGYIRFAAKFFFSSQSIYIHYINTSQTACQHCAKNIVAFSRNSSQSPYET